MSKRVSKWLSTKTIFFKDNEAAEKVKRFEDDPILSKIFANPANQDTTTLPEVINIDEIQEANPRSDDLYTTVRFKNGSMSTIDYPHSKLIELLLAREMYLDELHNVLLKKILEKIDL